MVVGKKRHKVCDCRNKQKHGALFVHRTYRYVLFWNRKVVVGSGVGGGGGEKQSFPQTPNPPVSNSPSHHHPHSTPFSHSVLFLVC